MTSLLIDVLPLALGAAVSPMLMIIQLFTLSGRTQRIGRATAIVLGSATSLAAITAVLLTLAKNVEVGGQGQADPFGSALRAVCAVVHLILGVRNVLNRNRPKKDRSERLASVRPRGYFVLGIAMMLFNVTSLVLYIPAMHLISRSTAGAGSQAAAVAMIFLFTMLPLLVPLLIAVSMGSKADEVLGTLNRFVTRHEPEINAGLCFVFAAYLGYQAFALR